MSPAVRGDHDARLDRLRRRGSPGSRPGTLHIPEDAQKPTFNVIAYGPDGIEERRLSKVGDVEKVLGQWPVVWLNVNGLGSAKAMRALAKIFDIHRLALEDIVNVPQRPKVDSYPGHLFISMRRVEAPEGKLLAEQISMLAGKGFVLTIQERPGDCFEEVRNRLRDGMGRIRKAGADYLAWALLDAIVDVQFDTLDVLGRELDALQERIFSQPDPELVREIHATRRDLVTFRRILWPTRELFAQLMSQHRDRFHEETLMYLRDGHDHASQILDFLESHLDVAAGLMDAYLNATSHRLNEIMKVLTVISTIFIPLSFVAGLYGMNFDPDASPWNMPELGFYFGYPMALGAMAAVAVGMLFFFRRRKWL